MKPILRDWLAELEQQGKLKRIHRSVSPINELAAVGKKLEPACGALFEHVEGSTMPVLTGIVTSRDSIAQSMGMTYEELMERFTFALNSPRPAVWWTAPACRSSSTSGSATKWTWGCCRPVCTMRRTAGAI